MRHHSGAARGAVEGLADEAVDMGEVEALVRRLARRRHVGHRGIEHTARREPAGQADQGVDRVAQVLEHVVDRHDVEGLVGRERVEPVEHPRAVLGAGIGRVGPAGLDPGHLAAPPPRGGQELARAGTEIQYPGAGRRAGLSRSARNAASRRERLRWWRGGRRPRANW